MKHFIRLLCILIALSVGTFAWAEETSASESKESATVSGEKENHESFRRSMEEQLAKIGREIDQLKIEAEKASGRLRSRLDEDLKTLGQRRDELEKELKKMSESTGRKWDQMKENLEKAFVELKKGFENAREELKK